MVTVSFNPLAAGAQLSSHVRRASLSSRLRRVLAFVLCGVVRGVALWRQMQVVAVVALLGAFAVIFEYSARRIANVALQVLGSARQAKFAGVELEVSPQTDLSLGFRSQPAPWGVILAQELARNSQQSPSGAEHKGSTTES